MKVVHDGDDASSRASATFLIDQALDYLYSAALRAAAVVGVADHMSERPVAPDVLAAATGTDAGNLYRVLRLLATRAVVAEDARGNFSLLPGGWALRSDSPSSVRSAVLMLTDRTMWEPAGQVAQCLASGATAFETIFEMPFFDWFARDAVTAATFHEGMASMSAVENEPIVSAIDFPATGTAIDVGGGHGGFLAAVLRSNPRLRGVLFDHPQVSSGAELDSAELSGRWESVSGDFFAEVPAGDVYLLKRILHDWDDADCVTILSRCRAGMPNTGRVMVIDAVIPPGNHLHQAKALDLVMMASLTGRERTRHEFESLFTRSGLVLRRIIPTGTALAVLEATRAWSPELGNSRPSARDRG